MSINSKHPSGSYWLSKTEFLEKVFFRFYQDWPINPVDGGAPAWGICALRCRRHGNVLCRRALPPTLPHHLDRRDKLAMVGRAFTRDAVGVGKQVSDEAAFDFDAVLVSPEFRQQFDVGAGDAAASGPYSLHSPIRLPVALPVTTSNRPKTPSGCCAIMAQMASCVMWIPWGKPTNRVTRGSFHSRA